MRLIFIAILLVTSLTIKLNVNTNTQIDDLNNFFTLACSQATNPISYSFQGLPQGFSLKDSQIFYTGSVGLQGTFPVKITATDAAGQTDTTIILLNVNLKGSGSINANTQAGLTVVNNFLSKAATVTGGNSSAVSSTASSSSSSSSSTTSSSAASSSSSNSLSQNGGSQILNINGVQYDFGNSLNLNVVDNNGNNGAIHINTGNGQTEATSINDLINHYSLDTSITASKNISSYPTPSVPTGPIPNSVPNTNILTISTAQASLSNGATNQITDYDTNITNLFYQQTQISQTIANLLQIIRQGTANRKQAQEDMNTYTASLNTAVTTQQTLSITISQQQTKVKSILSAIDGVSKELEGLNSNYTAVNAQITKVKSVGLGLTQQLSIAINNQDGLKQQINTTQGNIATITSQINSQSQSCAQANQIIAGIRVNISSLQSTIIGVDQKVAGIDSQIGDYNSQIALLQKQIDDLQTKVVQAKNDKQVLINLNYTVPQQIANLNAQIAFQQASCGSNGGYNNGDLTNAQNKLAGLQGQLTDSNNLVININSNISLAKAQLNDFINKCSILSQQITKSQNNLSALKQQLPLEQTQLNKLYIQGNQIIQTVKNTNSSLQAACSRFKRQSDSLTLANINLQQARTQQQTISQKINVILQQNTAGLPFPSAPECSGLLSSLTGTNSIDSISAFLLRAYGSTLGLQNLGGLSQIRTLYAFGNYKLRSNCPDIIISSQNANSTQSNSQDTASTYSGQGRVVSITKDNLVEVNTSQGTQKIALDDCSLRLANIPNYKINVGDVFVWKGSYDNSNKNWNAHQITCLQ